MYACIYDAVWSMTQTCPTKVTRKNQQVACQCHCQKCQVLIMAAALLSYKNIDKLFRNNAKFKKGFSNTKSAILNKPHLNLICKQCAVTSYYRVCFQRLQSAVKIMNIFSVLK